MSKERLEEIKSVNNDIKRFHNEFDHKQADIAKCYFYEKHGKWLIEQAELREEQVQRNLQALENINVLEGIYERLESENKRYREALEFYGYRDNYKLEHFDPSLDDYMSTVDYDEGKIARKALEGGE